MSDDLLERATAALRAATEDSGHHRGPTRARVLEEAQRRRAGWRGALARWFLTCVAVLLTGTALARVAPELPRALRHVFAAFAETPARRAPEPAAAPRAAAPIPAPPPRAAKAAPSAAPALEAKAAPEAPARPKRRARSAVATVSPALEPPEASLEPAPVIPAPRAESVELALFRRAERLHRARDPGALAAWDDYLRIAREGVLLPEARYNRALCLVRLGRRQEARAALAPFARGEYGGYRRTEAAALLRALDLAPTAPAVN